MSDYEIVESTPLLGADILVMDAWCFWRVLIVLVGMCVVF